MLILVLLSALIAAAVWGHAVVRANAARRDHEFIEALEEFQAQRRSQVERPAEPQASKPRRRSAPERTASTRTPA